MPYCHTVLKANAPENVESLIVTIAVEHFRARDAYRLTGGMWNIDAGENDVRAIQLNDDGIIRFFCRNQQYAERIEAKIADFANKHADKCTLLEVVE